VSSAGTPAGKPNGAPATTPPAAGPQRQVRVVGTGLIGTSIGLALVRAGQDVTLADPSPTAAALARDLGAGRLAEPDDVPDLVVVAAPPDVAAAVVVEQLAAWPQAVVTDVSSVKSAILAGVVRAAAARQLPPAALARYVGGHPMAGRERSGAVAARDDLFEGRPWVICAHQGTTPAAVEAVTWLARRAGAAVVEMPPEQHDVAVASVSHAPQVAASLVAARLRDLSVDAVGLAGQGIRDVTRIADSDPALWTQILAGNAGAVADVLQALQEDLAGVLEALRDLSVDPEVAHGARAVLARCVAAGQVGRARIPGKHGAAPTQYGVVTVVVRDEPGTVARLLADVGAAGVNMEDLRIEHQLGRKRGVVEVFVIPSAVQPLSEVLRGLGWAVHESSVQGGAAGAG